MEDGVTVREREEAFHEEEKDREKRQKVEGGGGILDNLLSKFVPESVHNEVQDHATACDQQSVGDADGDGDGGGGCGGVINNFISNLLNRNNNAEEDEDVKNDKEESEEEKLKSVNEESDNHVKTVPESNGVGEGGTSSNSNHGASIISSLVPEVVAPAPDEASILIHSIVHD